MRVATAVLAATTAALLAIPGIAQAVPATGLAGSLSNARALYSFDTSTPGVASPVLNIIGLQMNEGVVGIDYRPANGTLYGLTNQNRLYTINATTGVATLASTLTGTALDGLQFDVAFNPVVDRLRVVSDSGQNLRIDVDTGVVTADTGLAFASGDPNFRRDVAVTAAGYTNQLAGAASTTLYDIDKANNVLAIQNPPNNGTLTTVGPTNVGNLVSFDIDPFTNIGYAATPSALYQVNLATGGATLLGMLFVNSGGPTGFNTTDFALAPRAVPEPMSLALLGVGVGVAGLVAMWRRGKRGA